VPASKAGAELLFDVIATAYERSSVLLTTNLPLENWTEVLGSERLTGAALDRLTHRCHIAETTGESYRLQAAKRRRRTEAKVYWDGRPPPDRGKEQVSASLSDRSAPHFASALSRQGQVEQALQGRGACQRASPLRKRFLSQVVAWLTKSQNPSPVLAHFHGLSGQGFAHQGTKALVSNASHGFRGEKPVP